MIIQVIRVNPKGESNRFEKSVKPEFIFEVE